MIFFLIIEGLAQNFSVIIRKFNGQGSGAIDTSPEYYFKKMEYFVEVANIFPDIPLVWKILDP